MNPRHRRVHMRYVGGGTGQRNDPNVIKSGRSTFSTELPPGSEGLLHPHHDVEEVFFVLKSQVTCYFEQDGERVERALGPRDPVRAPAGAALGERDVADEVALLLVILGAGRPQRPTCPENSPLHSVTQLGALEGRSCAGWARLATASPLTAWLIPADSSLEGD